MSSIDHERRIKALEAHHADRKDLLALADRLTKLENDREAEERAVFSAGWKHGERVGCGATLETAKGGDSNEQAGTRNIRPAHVAPPPSSRAAEGGGERERFQHHDGESEQDYVGRKLKDLALGTREVVKRLSDNPISAEVVASAGIHGMANLLERAAFLLAQPAPEPAVQPLPAVAIGGSATGTNEPAVEDTEPNDNKEPSGPVCPVCEGRGELRDAVQAWDVPGAPVPECPYCDEGIITVESLDRLQHGAERTEPEPSEDVAQVLRALDVIAENLGANGHTETARSIRRYIARLRDCALARPEGERVEGWAYRDMGMLVAGNGKHHHDYPNSIPCTIVLHRASTTGSDE